jgi:hypothetical protein
LRSTEDAYHVAQTIIEIFKQGDPDSVMAFLPDEFIDNALERKRSRLGAPGVKLPDLTLLELLELARASDFHVDATAMRTLVLTPPTKVVPLSTLRVSPVKCLQRFALTAASGEEAAISFELQLFDALEAKYRSVRIIKKWFLRGITGEPSDVSEDIPHAPHPRHGPETVVLAQLAALREGDVSRVWAFASPRNREAFDGNEARFSEMLRSPPYDSLLGHASSEILAAKQMTPTRIFVVVGVTSAGQVGQKAVFGWALGLQKPSQRDDDAVLNCWMTEACYLV